jgi:transposase
MKYYAGLDVSLEWTSVCVVDEIGRVIREAKLASEPAALVAFFSGVDGDVVRIGLEAGPLSQWLHEGLAKAGLPVICVETRHMKAVLSAAVNKTDRNDARGIAQMMRAGLYRPVHVKTVASQERRMLLTNRKFVVTRLREVENNIRGTLRNFGLKVGAVGRRRFEERILELVSERQTLSLLVAPMLRVRAALVAEYDTLHGMVLATVRDDAVCRRLMTVPGVGPVVALSFRATIDVPARFARSKTVGAHFGLTPRKYQSGELDRTGRISKCGDEMMRTALYEAANSMLTRTTRWSWLKAWAMGVAKRRGMRKAKVALARKLAVILHRMWIDGTEFHWSREAAEPAAVAA